MRKLNWKKIVAGTLSAIMLLSVTACGSSSTKSESASTEASKKELTKVTFCLDWTPNTNHTGIYAAKALGYYEDAGLDVEIVQPPENGADFSKVKLIPNNITDEPAALKANQTDAIWVFYGWGGINAEVEGVDCDYWNFKDIDSVFDYYTPVMIANNDFLKNSPDEAKAFLAATKKGYQHAIDNPKKAADLLIAGDDTGSLKGSEDLVYKSQEWLSKQYVADADNWGVIDETRWNNFYKWLAENKLTTKDLTGKGFSNDYLPK